MSYSEYKQNKINYAKLCQCKNKFTGGDPNLSGKDKDKDLMDSTKISHQSSGQTNNEQIGWFSTITGTVSRAAVATKSLAAQGLINVVGTVTGVANCHGYYNKDTDGRYTSFYNFESMKQMDEFLDYVFDQTHEFNHDTILYHLQMKKVDGYVNDTPMLIKLLLNCKLNKSRLLEMIFLKDDVDSYVGMLNGTYITGPDESKNMINAFIRSLPGHVTNSIMNILSISDSDDQNIWDSYSVLLSFIGCVLDSWIENMFKVSDKMKESINNLNMPICFTYFDAMFDKKFGCKSNVNNLYNSFLKHKTNHSIESSTDQKNYNAMNHMTLNDFFNKETNPLCSLPPSVLFMLMIKINPKINDPVNHWNMKLKQLLVQMHVGCKGTTLETVEETTAGILKDQLMNLTQQMQDKNCAEDKSKKLSNVFSSFLSKSTKAMQTDQCNKLLMNKKIIEQSINEINKVSLVSKVVIPGAIKFTAADTVKMICDDRINWKIFDGLLTKIHVMQGSVFKLFNFTDNKMITHSIIKVIAGFITFLPIDLKPLFRDLLNFTKKEDIEYFNGTYDMYKIILYNDYTDTESKSDKSFHYTKYMNKNTMYPLFPPQELLDVIKIK